MVKPTVDPARPDPYGGFNFRVKWGDDGYVAGVSEVSALTPTTRVEHRHEPDRSASHESPGRAQYEPITMRRGVIYDPEFARWVNHVSSSDSVQPQGEPRRRAVSLNEFRRTLTIDVFDEAGRKMLSFKVHGAWVSALTGPARLDANENALAIESMTIEHEGCEVEAVE